MKKSPFWRAFTLVELLVSIAILSVLAALAFTGAGRMGESRNSVVCASNLRKIGVAVQLSINDNNGRYPVSRLQYRMDKDGSKRTVPFLPDLLNSYLNLQDINTLWWCPGDKKRPVNMRKYSYGHNQRLGGDYATPTEWNGEPNSAYDPRYEFVQNLQKPPSQIIFLVDFVNMSDEGKQSSSITARQWPLLKGSKIDAPTASRFDLSRHLNRVNALFLDGSVRSLGFDDLVDTEGFYITPF